MEYELEQKYQELAQKYNDYTPITLAEFEQILTELNLLKLDAPLQNAQILCHGAGERGANNLNSILNEKGLEIVRDHDGANNEVASGVLSTNICTNNPDNTINTSKTFGYAAYSSINEKGESFTIISAIPIKLDMTQNGINQKIALGRIIHQDSKTNNCVLDDLNIQAIPKQFILGVMKRNPMKPESPQEFKLNENFFALSEQNFLQAFYATMIMFAQSKYGSYENYYDTMNAKIDNALDMDRLPLLLKNGMIGKYQVDANQLNQELNPTPPRASQQPTANQDSPMTM